MAESSRSHHRFAEEWFEKLSAATVSPHSFTPFVKSGLGITRGKYVVGSQGRGTAGLIVRKAGTTTGAQLLTCAHVLGTPRDGSDQAAIEDNQVYSPHFKDCCGIECNSPIGMVIAGTLESRGPEFDQTTGERFVQAQLKIGQEAFAVDAALVDLVANINSYNRAPEIGQILPPRDLIVEWSLSDAKQLNLALPASRRLHVKKYGATTGYTEGTIRRLARKTVREYVPGAAAPVDTPALVFEIDPDPGQKAFSGEWEPDMDKYRSVLGPAITAKDVANRFASPSVTVIVGGTDSRPILRFSWSTFSQPGDSGSPIVDSANNVVGLLCSGRSKRLFVKDVQEEVVIDVGSSQAVFIGAALGKLQVSFLQGGQHAAGARIFVPGMSISRAAEEEAPWETLDAARISILKIPGIERLTKLFQRHFPEVRELIHRRRRVTVTWHRNKGPGFLAALARSIRHPERGFPVEIEGVRLPDFISAMQRVLRAEGSPNLRTEMAEHECELMEIAEQTIASGSVLVALEQHFNP